MGIFTRMRDIVNANINTMLEKAEDPEKLIKLMIQEMEDTLVEIKASCAGAMASVKKVQRKLDEAEARAEKWDRNAELALRKGREDLAREALQEKRLHDQAVESLQREQAETEAVVEQYREDIDQLEEKLAAAKEKHRTLVQRHIQASRKKAAQEQIRQSESSDAFRRFAEFENRIERMEAEAGLVNPPRTPSLDEAIADLEQDDAVEAELDALRGRIRSGTGNNPS